jgi:hypothetical protein
VRESGAPTTYPCLISVLFALTLPQCGPSQKYKDGQEALYAAECGVEVAKMYLAEACKSTAGSSELGALANTKGEVALPGYETPTNVILGQTIGAYVSVRLRRVDRDQGVWLVVSTGERSGTSQVVEARVTCSPTEVQPGASPAPGLEPLADKRRD